MKIDEAEKEIARILRDLEGDSGSVVKTLSVDDIEATSIEDERKRFERRVIIELERLPATQWGQAN